MAGDWIKMRVDLADDPAVIGIAARLGLDEFAVVGRLQALWSWADGQSRDGHAAGVTAAWVNRKVQCDGFAEAMASVSWLRIDETGITFPNFDNHNGETAKTRALGKNRKQKQRNGAHGHADVPEVGADLSRNQRDESVTREEKRREELIQDPIGSLSTSQPTGDQPGLDGIPDSVDQPKAKAGVPPCPYDTLIDLYHELCPTMPAVRRNLFKEGKRADAMLARWKWVMTSKAEYGDNAGKRMATTADEGVAWFRQFFEYAAESAFLRGERLGGDGRKWVADLGWLMVLGNFEKVMEGKYHGEAREPAHA